VCRIVGMDIIRNEDGFHQRKRGGAVEKTENEVIAACARGFWYAALV